MIRPRLLMFGVFMLAMSAWLVGDLRTSDMLLGPVYAEETKPEEAQPGVSERGVPLQQFPGGVLLGPDLLPLPVPPPNPTSSINKHCPRQDPGQGRILHFTVKNQGNAAAPESLAVVLFNPTNPPVGARIKALAANESTPVDIVIPSMCFAPNCSWAFHVDVAYEVSERVEKNNVLSGLCPG